MNLFFGLLCFIASMTARADSTLKGSVFEKGTRIPFAQTVIYVLPERIRLVTNESGEFEVILPDGEHTLVTNIPGFIKSSTTFTTPAD